ncbi:hypothetical protein BPAE_0125g00120 [Botrytis paeoniae]|uniref:Uncharacterized protein n=1 Tax=Botrytis paeoniae TaxID=278948 RepID=A0A4Z1FKU0_9HELO|nr:hypothetical protein BPAE_0125g00120 [Botrytis paeoniae]
MKLMNRVMLRKKMQQKNSEQLQQDQNTGDVTLDNHEREGDNNGLADNHMLLHYAQGGDLLEESTVSTSTLYLVNLHHGLALHPNNIFPPRVEIWNAIRHIKKWLNQCVSLDSPALTGHQCPEISKLIMPVLPTRVLDVSWVGADGKVYLVHSNGKRQNNTTVSHCWGDANYAPITLYLIELLGLFLTLYQKYSEML